MREARNEELRRVGRAMTKRTQDGMGLLHGVLELFSLINADGCCRDAVSRHQQDLCEHAQSVLCHLCNNWKQTGIKHDLPADSFAPHSGGGCTRDLITADWHDIENNATSEFHMKRCKSKEVTIKKLQVASTSPCADDSLKQEGQAQR